MPEKGNSPQLVTNDQFNLKKTGGGYGKSGKQTEIVTGKLYELMSPGVAMGGGPLWGINGVVSIAHGNNRAAQIVGTIKHTKQAVENGFVDTLRHELEKVREKSRQIRPQ